jgi:hypothetical protein
MLMTPQRPVEQGSPLQQSAAVVQSCPYIEQIGATPESIGLPLAPLLVPLVEVEPLGAAVPVEEIVPLDELLPLEAPLEPTGLPHGPQIPCVLPDGWMHEVPGQQSADVVQAPQLATHCAS